MSAESPQGHGNSIRPLEIGSPVAMNWRTINAILAEQQRLRRELIALRAYVDSLRPRRGGAGSEIGICPPG